MALSDREQWLVVLGPAVVVAAIHLSYWLHPLRKDRLVAEAEVARLEGERDRARSAPAAGPDQTKALTARRDALRADLAREVEADPGAAAMPIADETRAVARVSELADRAGLLIGESLPEPATADALPRPRRRLVVVGTFEGIRAFLNDLATAPGARAQITTLTLEPTAAPPSDIESPPPGGPRNVRATMVLVL